MRDGMRLKADWLKALAQPVRLRIIELLRGGEKCVCEIAPLLGEEQSNVSRHLAVLRNSGLVAFRKEGVSTYYRVADERVFEILDIVDAILKSSLNRSLESLLSARGG
ncbi:MAG: ArsR/SmtB family transcription factor [bacterium]